MTKEMVIAIKCLGACSIENLESVELTDCDL